MSKKALPQMKRVDDHAAEEATTTVEEQTTVAVIDPVTVIVELNLSPTFVRGGNIKRHLNMTKRLTERQAKALRAIVNITHSGRQTEAVQTLLDQVADAIENQCNVSL